VLLTEEEYKTFFAFTTIFNNQNIIFNPNPNIDVYENRINILVGVSPSLPFYKPTLMIDIINADKKYDNQKTNVWNNY